jgi:hypothetical protein
VKPEPGQIWIDKDKRIARRVTIARIDAFRVYYTSTTGARLISSEIDRFVRAFEPETPGAEPCKK